MNMDAGKHENSRDVDQWLDEALAQYGKVEPRAGLERRLLARLAGEQQQSRRSLGWWAIFAFSAAALAFVLFWLGRVDLKHVPVVPVAKVAVPPRAGESTAPGERSPARNVAHARDSQTFGPAQVGQGKVGRGEFVSAALTNRSPKMEQFPAPLPLTDQERMLALYVEKFPEKAALVAKAQSDLRKRDDLEMAAPWPMKAAGSSEQQE